MAAPSAEALRERLEQRLGAELVQVEAAPGTCGGSFRLLVVSSSFRGKRLLDRHRLVNEALGEELERIHALQQRTLTPEQWEEEQRKSA